MFERKVTVFILSCHTLTIVCNIVLDLFYGLDDSKSRVFASSKTKGRNEVQIRVLANKPLRKAKESILFGRSFLSNPAVFVRISSQSLFQAEIIAVTPINNFIVDW